MIKPLEKNDGGYFGETIVISDILDRALIAAKQFGWTTDNFPGSSALPLYGFSRISKHERLSVYISSGIHGDEPGGPMALTEMIEADFRLKRSLRYSRTSLRSRSSQSCVWYI